jgi:hypothetical protein
MGWTDKLAEMLRLNDGEQAYVGYPQMQVGLTKPRQAGYATGFLEGATGMDSMQPKNPITDPNYSAYEQGKNTGELAGIGSMAVPGYVAALKASAPKAYNALENYMVKSGGMIPLEAWHGTPHKIEGNFDISKVGTGEGSQAFGHGMYFAENPAVAKGYVNAAPFKGNKAKELPEHAWEEIGPIMQKYNISGDMPIGKDEATALSEMLFEHGKKMTPTEKSVFEKWGGATGNLYKVDIPDEHIPNMLDWDKPLKKQPIALNAIRNAITDDKILKSFDEQVAKGMVGKDAYENWVNLNWVGENGMPTFKTDKEASQKLNDLGIKGIKFFDEKSRSRSIIDAELDNLLEKHNNNIQTALNEIVKKARLKGKAEESYRKDMEKLLNNRGTRNFVVFDPSTVKILEENGKPLTRKELIEEQVNKLKD